MNLQYLVLANKKTIDNEKLNDSLQDLANSIKENNVIKATIDYFEKNCDKLSGKSSKEILEDIVKTTKKKK